MTVPGLQVGRRAWTTGRPELARVITSWGCLLQGRE